MSINNIELNEIKLIIDEAKDINISEKNSEKLKTNNHKEKNNFNLKANLFIKETLSEIEFKKIFKMTTCDVEYKEGMFYKKVKMILESNKLTAYDKLQETQTKNIQNIYSPLLVLNFDQITAEVSVIPESNKFTIYVLGCKRVFQFRSDKKEIYKTVLYYLNYFLKTSIGSRTNMLGVSLRNDFHKVNKKFL